MTIGRPQNLSGTRTGAMIEFITAKGPEGARRAELAELLGVPSQRISGYMEYAGKCGVIVAGPVKHHRFFIDPEHAAAYEAQCPEMIRKQQEASYQERLRRQRDRLRATYVPKPRKKAAPKLKKEPLPRVPLRLGNKPPVNVKAPTRAELSVAAMVIPSGVEVQRCKPWTHDVRYSVEPGRRVIGEFTTEWRQRRAA